MEMNMLTAAALTDIETVDAWLDDAVSENYRACPLAQDWARVAKAVEEAGEAVAALIAATGQNPRKGVCGTQAELLAELADLAMTGMLAIQHFTKDTGRTHDVLAASLAKVTSRAMAAGIPVEMHRQ
jgi:hypothetical protein